MIGYVGAEAFEEKGSGHKGLPRLTQSVSTFQEQGRGCDGDLECGHTRKLHSLPLWA